MRCPGDLRYRLLQPLICCVILKIWGSSILSPIALTLPRNFILSHLWQFTKGCSPCGRRSSCSVCWCQTILYIIAKSRRGRLNTRVLFFCSCQCRWYRTSLIFWPYGFCWQQCPCVDHDANRVTVDGRRNSRHQRHGRGFPYQLYTQCWARYSENVQVISAFGQAFGRA